VDDDALDFCGVLENVVGEVCDAAGSFFDSVGREVDVLICPFAGYYSLRDVSSLVFYAN